MDYFKSSGSFEEDVVLVVDEGSSLKSISRKLAENNVIEYPELFTMLIRILEPSTHLKAGQYLFEAKSSPLEVFQKLATGDVIVHKITIAEGLMTIQIRDIVENAEFMQGEFPDGVKEGELLPETYDYYYGDSREDFVNRMKLAMKDLVDELWEKRAKDLPINNKKDAVILASIIEKETGVKAERSRVSAVFVNRLNRGMRLQTDPTVIYSITEGEYVMERPLRFKDLEIKSPYNTYKNYGLPPTPIAHPGRKAIEAALNPDKTEEFYFVANGTGGHSFSSTLKEHNEKC